MTLVECCPNGLPVDVRFCRCGAEFVAEHGEGDAQCKGCAYGFEARWAGIGREWASAGWVHLGSPGMEFLAAYYGRHIGTQTRPGCGRVHAVNRRKKATLSALRRACPICPPDASWPDRSFAARAEDPCYLYLVSFWTPQQRFVKVGIGNTNRIADHVRVGGRVVQVVADYRGTALAAEKRIHADYQPYHVRAPHPLARSRECRAWGLRNLDLGAYLAGRDVTAGFLG
jgi:hypothetical protein